MPRLDPRRLVTGTFGPAPRFARDLWPRSITIDVTRNDRPGSTRARCADSETDEVRSTRSCNRRHRGLPLRQPWHAPLSIPADISQSSSTCWESAREELARRIKVPTNRVTQILNGQRAVTGDTALRLGHFLRTGSRVLAEPADAFRPESRRARFRTSGQVVAHSRREPHPVTCGVASPNSGATASWRRSPCSTCCPTPRGCAARDNFCRRHRPPEASVQVCPGGCLRKRLTEVDAQLSAFSAPHESTHPDDGLESCSPLRVRGR